MIQDPNYDIRYTRILDKPALARWLRLLVIQKWFAFDNDHEVEIMAANWVGFYRFKASLTATFDHKPIGMATLFLMPYKKVSHMSMFNIVVDPSYQKRGVGTSLMRNLIHLAKTEFHLLSLHGEVMEGSDLISVLKKLDFYEVFRQEDYYHTSSGKKARIVMEVKL